MRRLLNGTELLPNETFALPTTSNNVPFPGPTTPFKPNAWYYQGDDRARIVTPSVYETKHNMFHNVPIYGHVTQAMALDDNILDIQATVSTHKPNCVSKEGPRLTLQCLKESHQ